MISWLLGLKALFDMSPDYEQHVEKEGFTDDYWSLTTGPIAVDQGSLNSLLQASMPEKEDRQKILDYFFGYLPADSFDRSPKSGHQADIDRIIEAAEAHVPSDSKLPALYSFDVFDTLVRRTSLSPVSVFHRVQD